MNLLADESVDGPIVDRLRADNHSVLYVAELDPGISDDVVLHQAERCAVDHGGQRFRRARFSSGTDSRGCRAHSLGGTVS